MLEIRKSTRRREQASSELRGTVRVRAMGDGARSCKRNAAKEASSTSTTGMSKRRKLVASDNSRLLASLNSELENGRSGSPEFSRSFGEMAAGDLCSCLCGSDQLTVSRCSSNDSGEVVKERLRLVDLEANVSETENSTYVTSKFSGDGAQRSPTSKLYGDSEEMESPAKPPAVSQRRKVPAGKMPPRAEIEEFFSAAERYEQKRFVDKYNYDIVKDMPLEGRFQWVRLKP